MEKRFPDWNKNLNRELTQRVADTLAEDTSRIVHRFSAVEEHYWAGWYFGTVRDLLAPAKTDHHRVWRAGAAPLVHAKNHHSGCASLAQNDRRRQSAGALEIPITSSPFRR